jgi:phosphoribosylaminoimidazole carboxylase/phosphoribosylaminoimidazole-succinocarboxamide synthase
MEKGKLLCKGKTKEIYEVLGREGMVIIRNKDDITKNDDPDATKVFAGKGACATTTTCVMFQLLKAAGIPVAFEDQLGANEFLAPACQMIPLEVVVRRYAVGSYLQRFPQLRKEEGEPPFRFHRLELEFFLKTSGGRLVGSGPDSPILTPLDPKTGRPVDDPFIEMVEGDSLPLRHPKKNFWSAESLIANIDRSILPHAGLIDEMGEIARQVFLLLEGVWAQLSCRLIDFKIEFGFDASGELMVADVIDNDSWRLRRRDWQELSKQLFRDNANEAVVMENYNRVAIMTSMIEIPIHALVVWSDHGHRIDTSDISGFFNVDVVERQSSAILSPMSTLFELEELLLQYPDGGVIIAPDGLTSGLASMLAAHGTWPLISVPYDYESAPIDIVNCPGRIDGAPVLMAFSWDNATQAALKILAVKNPFVYMHCQYEIEKHNI